MFTRFTTPTLEVFIMLLGMMYSTIVIMINVTINLPVLYVSVNWMIVYTCQKMRIHMKPKSMLITSFKRNTLWTQTNNRWQLFSLNSFHVLCLCINYLWSRNNKRCLSYDLVLNRENLTGEGGGGVETLSLETYFRLPF